MSKASGYAAALAKFRQAFDDFAASKPGAYSMRLSAKNSVDFWLKDNGEPVVIVNAAVGEYPVDLSVLLALAGWITDTFGDAAPSNVGRAGSEAADGDPQGASGPRA